MVHAASAGTEKAASSDQNSSTTNLPNNLPLNDDTLLEKTELTESVTSDTLPQKNLDVLDQCILLAFCLNVKNTNPVDGITKEQMWPFVSVLYALFNWFRSEFWRTLIIGQFIPWRFSSDVVWNLTSRGRWREQCFNCRLW